MEKLNRIKIAGKEYPYKCSNIVLAQIQEKYGTLTEFINKIAGREPLLDKDGTQKKNEDGLGLYKKTEPSLSAVNFLLPLVIMEGLEIEAEKKGKEAPELNVKALIRSIDLNPFEIAKLLEEEIYRAIAIKK
jgi:hypothetical protein